MDINEMTKIISRPAKKTYYNGLNYNPREVFGISDKMINKSRKEYLRGEINKQKKEIGNDITYLKSLNIETEIDKEIAVDAVYNIPYRQKKVSFLINELSFLEKNNNQRERIDVNTCKKFPIENIIGRSPDRMIGAKACFKCPLHEDNTPSFVVYPENTWYCFGCGKGGDSIQLYMELHNCNFTEACKALQ